MTKASEYHKERRAALNKAGLCHRCQNPCAPRKTCLQCQEKAKIKRALARSIGFCTRCKNQPQLENSVYCERCYNITRTAIIQHVTNRLNSKLCRICGKPNTNTKSRCDECIEIAIKLRKSRIATRLAAGQCTTCGDQSINNMKTCDKCRLTQQLRRRDLRESVFTTYGGSICVCCGETREILLTIDHSDGGGQQHRKVIGKGNLYRWLQQNGYPIGFQVLCMSCNFSKGQNGGKCHHQLDREAAISLME